MKYIHKQSKKILSRLGKGEAPPQEWFEAQGILGTYVGDLRWLHYYFDGRTYRVLRTDEVNPYGGDLDVGEVEEAEVAA